MGVATRYHPRRFDQSPLFQVVYHHFDHFREAYHRHYADYLGHLRPIVTHTINRFLLCGDPREGVARYDCPHCNHSVAVPFSCKTRLFCPSCHDLKTLLWIEAIQAGLLLPVAHRFWTFSIPKRLRYYCLRNRKLLSLIVSAAVNTLAKSLTGGRLHPKLRPGIVALIQTHADSLDWNCHLHLVVTDGAVDYSNAATPTFKPCAFWDSVAMTEIFRFSVIETMFKKGVLTPDVANNLASWRHSGFHVHASSPFMPGDTELLRTRLAYAFRPPVALGRMDFDGTTVTVRTNKKQLLQLKACITDPIAIAKACPHSARAPPQLTFDRYLPPTNGIAYGKGGDESPDEPTAEATDNAHFNQAPPDDDAFFNQACPEPAEWDCEGR